MKRCLPLTLIRKLITKKCVISCNSLLPKKQLFLARALAWATPQFTKYFELQRIFSPPIRALNKCRRLLFLLLSIQWNLVNNPIIIIVFLCEQGQSLSWVNPFSWHTDLFKSAVVTNINRRRLIVSYNEESWITNCRVKYFFVSRNPFLLVMDFMKAIHLVFSKILCDWGRVRERRLMWCKHVQDIYILS